MDATNNRTVLKKCSFRGVAGDPQKKSVCYGFFFKREKNYETVLIKYVFFLWGEGVRKIRYENMHK